MSIEDDPVGNLLTFPSLKRKDTKRALIAVETTGKKCEHNRVTYDREKADLTCSDCAERINAHWYIGELCRKEHLLWRTWKELRASIALMREESKTRERTKCDHCGSMTRIRFKFGQIKLFEMQAKLDMEDSE